MKFLLALTLIVLMIADAFALDLSLGPGLSVKNAMLYLVAMGLAMRIVVQGRFRWSMPKLHIGFAILIGYAMLSVVFAGVISKLPGYEIRDAVISLKSNLIDLFLFFAVFYYGLQTKADALKMMSVMLAVVMFSSVITVGNVTGLVSIGTIEVSEQGRVQGALGEQNQYGAFLVLFLPALFAAWAYARSFVMKAIWLFAAVISMGALIMTVSRGAFLALLVAVFVGGFIFHRQLPMQRLLLWSIAGFFVVLLFAFATGYIDLLQERVIGQTFVTRGDASSGRTEIWEQAVNRMMGTPLSMLTGFGWFAYESMGFRYATHNHYLLLWFNIGIAGVIAFLMILWDLYRTNRTAARVTSDPELRSYCMAAVFGLMGLAIAIFFVNLFKPWPYIWAFFGISARLAAFALAEKKASEPVAVKSRMRPAHRPPRWQTHASMTRR